MCLIRMVGGVFLFFFVSSTWAANLCDAQCALTISFPSGGSIEAVEDFTITFGASGLIDTIGSVTAYTDGETLTLNSGDKLVFASGGSFNIGAAGNIDFTRLMIITTGIVGLEAMGGNETVMIPQGGSLSVFGGPGWNINASVLSISGSIELSEAGSLSLFNSLASGCLLSVPPGSGIRISGYTVAVTPDNSACLSITLGATILPISNDPTITTPPTNPPDTDSSESGSAALSFKLSLMFLFLLALSTVRKSRPGSQL